MDKFQALLQNIQIAVYGAGERAEKSLRATLAHATKNIEFLSWSTPPPEHFSGDKSCFVLVLAEEPAMHSLLVSLNLQGIEAARVLLMMPEEKAQGLARIYGAQYMIHLENHADLVLSLLRLWDHSLQNLLAAEVSYAQESGSLSLLEESLQLTKGQCIERAQLAFTLAIQLTMDRNEIERTIRLALYYPLLTHPNGREIARSARHLWCLLPFFEKNQEQSEDQIALLVVEVADLAHKHAEKQEKEFRLALKELSAPLPFKLRTKIRNGAERSFKELWKRSHEAA